MIINEPIITSTFLKEAIRSRASSSEVILEIGTGPSSTPLLVELSEAVKLTFYTIDTARDRIAWAQQLMRGKDKAFAICTKGEIYLRQFKEQIIFAYLDSYDWVDAGDPDAYKYSARCSKRESELVHLEQTMEVVRHMSSQGLILFDDTWFLEKKPPASRALSNKVDFRTLTSEYILKTHDVFGKGSLAVPFLLCCGYGIAAISERPHLTQVLLQRQRQDIPEKHLLYSKEYFYYLLQEHRLVTYRVRPSLARWKAMVGRDTAKPVIDYMRSVMRVRTRLKEMWQRVTFDKHKK